MLEVRKIATAEPWLAMCSLWQDNLSVSGSDKSSLVICVSGNSIENVKRIGSSVREVNPAYNVCSVVTLYIQTG